MLVQRSLHSVMPGKQLDTRLNSAHVRTVSALKHSVFCGDSITNIFSSRTVDLPSEGGTNVRPNKVDIKPGESFSAKPACICFHHTLSICALVTHGI